MNFAKVFKSCDEAAKQIKPGMTVLQGGFGICGIPHSMIMAISRNQDIKDLTWVANDIGLKDVGAGYLSSQGQISKFIISFITNKHTEKQFLEGDIEVELIP